MEHLVGYVIIILSVVLSGGMLFWGWLDWRRRQPKRFYRGVGIVYDKSAVEPWEGLEQAIDTMQTVLSKEYPGKALLEDVWIKVVGPEGKVAGFTVPSGMIDGKPISGTVDRDRFLWWKAWILVVRQMPARNEDPETDDMIRPAASSALFHEMATHLTPFRLGKGWNHTHEEGVEEKVWEPLRLKMKNAPRA
jgi:hypothetical protein